jgi:hypothetical protein
MHLNKNSIFVLAQASAAKHPITEVEVWKSSAELGLTGYLSVDWLNLITELNGVGVTLRTNEEDVLIWTGGDKKGVLTVKNVYAAILSLQDLPALSGWQSHIWKWHLPLKVILFFWLAINNKILTWDILQKKGWVGPSYCILCGQQAEDINHLFIECIFTKSVWNKCEHLLQFKHQWVGYTLQNCMDLWFSDTQVSNRLPLLLCWFLWKERNLCLFEGHFPRPGRWLKKSWELSV